MMDDRTRKTLLGIGLSLPPSLLRRGIVKEKPFADAKQMLKDIATDKKAPRNVRAAARKVAENPKLQEQFERESTTIDEKVNIEIEERVGAQVRRAIALGILPPPPRNDSFFNFVMAHKHAGKKPTPLPKVKVVPHKCGPGCRHPMHL